MVKLKAKRKKFDYKVDPMTMSTFRAMEDEYGVDKVKQDLMEGLLLEMQLGHVKEIAEETGMENFAPTLGGEERILEFLKYAASEKQVLFTNPKHTCWIGSRIAIENRSTQEADYIWPVVCLPTRLDNSLSRKRKLSAKDANNVWAVGFAANDFEDASTDVNRQVTELLYVPPMDELMKDFEEWIIYNI